METVHWIIEQNALFVVFIHDKHVQLLNVGCAIIPLRIVQKSRAGS